jgi:hypothetical protein
MQRFFKGADKKKDIPKSIEIIIPSVLWEISSVENIEVFNHGLTFLSLCTEYLKKKEGTFELIFFLKHLTLSAITQVGLFRRAGDNDNVAILQQILHDGKISLLFIMI